MSTMHIPADVAASIRQNVQSGRFGDEGAVLREALRLLDARERRAHELRASIEDGVAAIERGEGVELTPEFMDRLTREADEMDERGELPSPDVCP